jgi:hypothetical protein
MAEVLVTSNRGAGVRDHRMNTGHKAAMQAVSLLAITSFNIAADLFFDMVDRFCHVRAKSEATSGPTQASDDYFQREMQNYDQMFVRMLSKHWASGRHDGTINLDNPLARIRSLRADYELPHKVSLVQMKHLRHWRHPDRLFADSVEILRLLQRRRTAKMLRDRISSARPRRQSIGNMIDMVARRSKEAPAIAAEDADMPLEDGDVRVPSRSNKEARTEPSPPRQSIVILQKFMEERSINSFSSERTSMYDLTEEPDQAATRKTVHWKVHR